MSVVTFMGFELTEISDLALEQADRASSSALVRLEAGHREGTCPATELVNARLIRLAVMDEIIRRTGG